MQKTLFKPPFKAYLHYALYGAAVAFSVFALKWLQWKFLIADSRADIYVGLIALFFTILGIWIASQRAGSRVREVVIEKVVHVHRDEPAAVDEKALENLGLTVREQEVLQLLSKGYSNAEIADRLFLSVSTVKTHVSNLYVKMNVKNRGRAIEKAKRLKLAD